MDAGGLGVTQQNSESALEATQGGEAAGGETTSELGWAEASIWTERMMSALGNGVKGGKWFSLMDKVYRPSTLEVAWRKAQANKGSPGIDGQSIERFATGARLYLTELHESLEVRPVQSLAGQAGRYSQGERSDPSAGDTVREGSHRPDGAQDGD